MYAQNLKKLRQYLNLSTNELSKKLQIPSRTLAAYERKERTPSIELVVQLREKLGVDINWFLTGAGEMFSKATKKQTQSPIEKYKNWGERLTDFLNKNNVSKNYFSKLTGIKISRIENMIDNSTNPTIEEINSIKQNTDVSIDWLLYGEACIDELGFLPFAKDEIIKLRKLVKN